MVAEGAVAAVEHDADRLCGIHVLGLHEPARLISPDREQGHLRWAVGFPYLAEETSVAIGSVADVVEHAALAPTNT